VWLVPCYHIFVYNRYNKAVGGPGDQYLDLMCLNIDDPDHGTKMEWRGGHMHIVTFAAYSWLDFFFYSVILLHGNTLREVVRFCQLRTENVINGSLVIIFPLRLKD